MKQLVSLFGYLLVRALYAAVSLLPHGVSVWLFARVYLLVLVCSPKLSRAVHENLVRAFPNAAPDWIEEIKRKHATEIGRLAADTVRLPRLNHAWVSEHVSFPHLQRYLNQLAACEGRGVLIATGHLGSFELMGHAIGVMGHPLAAVARRFRSPLLDRWWNGLRQASGNQIISRKGAFKEMVHVLQSGRSVAVLFDQNVTRNHAIFVDWFGESAATTKSVGLAALRTEAPLFVASMKYVGNDRYEIDAEECDCSDVYRDTSLSSDEKVRVITQRLSDRYCRMITEFPEGWFWMHRRWKTRPLVAVTQDTATKVGAS